MSSEVAALIGRHGAQQGHGLGKQIEIVFSTQFKMLSFTLIFEGTNNV
jgi:hypothetical protein